MSGALRTARMLTRYNAWADEVMFEAVARLPEGEATRPRQSIFKDMLHTMNHIYVIDRVFQAHVEGRGHGYTARNTPTYPALPELRAAQREMDRWLIDWSDRMSEPALDERIAFSYIGGGEGVMSKGDILLHLVNHTTYHRGFVADFFCQVPARPPTTDLTVYLRDVPQEV